jgi:hypothetical protein
MIERCLVVIHSSVNVDEPFLTAFRILCPTSMAYHWDHFLPCLHIRKSWNYGHTDGNLVMSKTSAGIGS